MPLARLAHPVNLLSSFPLDLQVVGDLSQLGIELPNVSVAVSLNELHGTRALVVRRVSGEETLYHRLHAGVAEGKDLPPWREHYDGYLSSAQSAKLTGLLEKARAALRESHLKVAVIGHLDHLNLLTTLAFPHHG